MAVKLVFCVRRRPDLSVDGFRTYWRDTHGPLVASFAADLKVQRYVQSHTVAPELNATLAATRNAGEPFDGVAELWWRDAETLEAAMATPEGQAAGQALLEDERRFIDLERSTLFLTEEHEVV